MGCRDCSGIKLQTPQKSSLKALVSKQARTDSNGKPFTSVRWNPTPEQLFALEELYRCGTQSPSAQQIQQITCRLRRFGKIEGKNVFYWFQNHKARERQKRSREIKSFSNEKHWNIRSSFGKINEIGQTSIDSNYEIWVGNVDFCSYFSCSAESLSAGLSRKSQEFLQAKMWMPHLKSSNILPNQECLSMSTPAMANKIRLLPVFESVDDLFSKQSPWKPAEASFSPAHPSFIATHLTNTLLKPYSEIHDEYFRKVEDRRGEIQTLELFPLQSGSEDGTGAQLAGDVQKPMDNNLRSRLFFEFLPLKN